MEKRNKINYDAIPNTLKVLNQWVWWRAELKADGKVSKVPMNAKNGRAASHSDPETWASYKMTLKYHESHGASAGIGFVFSADDPYVGIDLDDCRNPDTGKIAQWAQEFIDLSQTYTESSPSGGGGEAMVKGKDAG